MDSSKENPLSREEDRRQCVERYFSWWCDDCDRKTQWIECEDGTYQCQSCGGTV